MKDLFTNSEPENEQISGQPLADQMRPQTLDQFWGQRHLLAEGMPLRVAIESGQPHSMIFWGPPGTGKTTLARIIANQVSAQFITISAVLSGVKEIRAAIDSAKVLKQVEGRGTVLFVDEVHRFNKSQQDAFLPHVENGTVIFIGATTENPSFELNNALLSRARVYKLQRLDDDALMSVVNSALEDNDHGLGSLNLNVSDHVKDTLVTAADGDARRLLNLLEIAADLSVEINGQRTITEETLSELIKGDVRRFDKGGEDFYDQISALHKSVRGSDPDASLYWLARMIDGGCDPLYVARRVVRMASEDIGNADPRALEIALNAWDVQERLGSPEGELAIAHAVVYLASVPKSNAVYMAWKQVMADVQSEPSHEVPVHLRNAPTKLMKELGYGKEYRYAHDEPEAYAAGEHYFPEEMPARHYYHPTDRGLEAKIAQRLAYLKSLDESER